MHNPIVKKVNDTSKQERRKVWSVQIKYQVVYDSNVETRELATLMDDIIITPRVENTTSEEGSKL